MVINTRAVQEGAHGAQGTLGAQPDSTFQRGAAPPLFFAGNPEI